MNRIAIDCWSIVGTVQSGWIALCTMSALYISTPVQKVQNAGFAFCTDKSLISKGYRV